MERAADRYRHDEIDRAWTDVKVHADWRRLRAIQATFPVPTRTVHQDGTVIILTFTDNEGVCVDFRSAADGSIVTARRC